MALRTAFTQLRWGEFSPVGKSTVYEGYRRQWPSPASLTGAQQEWLLAGPAPGVLATFAGMIAVRG